MTDFDIIVIGAGPGGYTAAIRASQYGAKVALIEKGEIGGTCLNRGCIPTKALLASSELFNHIKHAGDFGVEAGTPKINWPKIIERKNQVVAKLVTGLTGLIKGRGIEIINGSVDFSGGVQSLSSGKVTVKTGNEAAPRAVSAKKIILAMGSEPADIAGFPIDHERVLDSTDVLSLPSLPKSLAIIGGGVMGVEFASLFALLGVEVSIYEMMDRLLPREEAEISQLIERIFKRYGININTSAKDLSADKIETEKILITIGRKLNLPSAPKTKAVPIAINAKMETGVANVYAIGDITGKHMTAHSAGAQGKVAAATACHAIGLLTKEPEELKTEINYPLVPQAIYTVPEIARVGLTSEELTAKGQPYKVGKFPFAASSRALILGERDGFVKVLSDPESGKLLGAHLIGHNATELLTEFTLAANNNLTAENIMATVHPHPSLSESLAEAVENIFGLAISIKN